MIPAIARLIAAMPAIEFMWLSDGVDLGRGAEFVAALARTIEGRTITVIAGGLPTAHALIAADNAAGALTVKVLRVHGAATAEEGLIRALDLKGLPLGVARFSFNAGAQETDAEINLPVEIRNDIARLEIMSEQSAGAVQLLDKRWRRRTIGVISGATAETAQPLLASTFYLCARAQSVRRRAACGRRVARGSGTSLPRSKHADADPRRRRHRHRRGARQAFGVGRETVAYWCVSRVRDLRRPMTILCQ